MSNHIQHITYLILWMWKCNSIHDRLNNIQQWIEDVLGVSEWLDDQLSSPVCVFSCYIPLTLILDKPGNP